MFSKLKKPDNKGFTIIEVMIVLAIAALILLIVLLAVPALQRNSRNTAIKNDASSLAGAINTFESDNNGTVPTTFTDNTGGSIDLTDGAGDKETARLQGSTKVDDSTTSPPTATGDSPTITTGELQVWKAHTCPAPGSNVPSTRAFAIFYVTESSGGNTLQCLDS